MKARWELLKQNIGTDSNVAILINEKNNEPVLYVNELRNTYRASPFKKYSVLDEFFVPYVEAKCYVNSILGIESSNDDFSEKCLEYACDQIKLDFDKHVSSILELLS